VFSLVNAILINPFPFPDADHLVEIESRAGDGSWYSTVRVGDFGLWRDQNTVFEAISTYGWDTATLTGQSVGGLEDAERIVSGMTTEAFLRVLGVRLALGRFFTREEDEPGGAPVVVLSYGTWVRRFGKRSDVLGSTLTLDGKLWTIVGVMPAHFALPGMFTCELWKPAAYNVARELEGGYNTRWDGAHVIARLKRGVSWERARTELDTMTTRLALEYPGRRASRDARIVPLGADLRSDQGARLRLLSLIVATGLLLACVNLTGLLLARSGARSREMAVRASLGATRWRLVRYALTEAILLATAGGALGIALTTWGISAIGTAAPPYLGLDSALRMDPTVVVFATVLSLLTGLGFGLIPALRGSNVDLTSALKGTSSGGRPLKRGRVLSALVVAEVSLAVLLLTGGGLMAKSFLGLMTVDTGIRDEGLLTFRLSLADPKYNSAARRHETFSALLEGLRLIPGVTSAAGVSPLPMSRQYSGGGFRIEGRPAPANPRDMMSQFCQATPGYFRTMGVPVKLGREFEQRDGVSTASVVLVNEALAQRFFTGENPVGQRLVVGPSSATIVGVVGDVRHNGPTAEPDPQIYYPVAARTPQTLSIVLRTPGSPASLVSLVRQQVRGLDPHLPVDQIKSMHDIVAASVADVRILTSLIAGFAVFALVLATIGVYGVVSYAVSQRQHELAVRIALGASRQDIVALVLARGALLAVLGIAVGGPVAFASVRLLSSVLNGVSPHDRGVFTAIPLLLFLVAVAASYLPARRAARIHPLSSMRSE